MTLSLRQAGEPGKEIITLPWIKSRGFSWEALREILGQQKRGEKRAGLTSAFEAGYEKNNII
jgi:hypothetical protein